MRNCLKYAQQCKNGILKKTLLGNNSTLFSYVDLPSILCTQWKYGESPYKRRRKTRFAALLFAEFKNRYVNVNTNL